MGAVVNAFEERQLHNKTIVELLNRLFYEADARMLYALERPEDLRLSIPFILQERIHEAFSFYYNMANGPNVTWWLRGVEIIPAVDMAITLYHKDYVLYKEDWMIRKVPLAIPRKFEREWYTEYVLALHEAFSYFKDDNVESN